MNEFQNFFIAGELCLDFCNTFDHLHTPPEVDHFSDGAAVLRWAQTAGILPVNKKSFPSVNERSYKKLLETRTLLFKIFLPFTHAALPSKSDLDSLNALLQEKYAKVKIVLDAKRFLSTFEADDAFEKIEYETIRGAADLLLSITPGRLKQCEGCGWLFYDQSRTHARRWCTMDLCGNRAKARRHYERVKQK